MSKNAGSFPNIFSGAMLGKWGLPFGKTYFQWLLLLVSRKGTCGGHWKPNIWNMYLLIKMVMFQPVMLVLGRVTLPKTNSLSLKMDGWNTFSFPFGSRPIFWCENVKLPGCHPHLFKQKTHLLLSRSLSTWMSRWKLGSMVRISGL